MLAAGCGGAASPAAAAAGAGGASALDGCSTPAVGPELVRTAPAWGGAGRGEVAGVVSTHPSEVGGRDGGGRASLYSRGAPGIAAMAEPYAFMDVEARLACSAMYPANALSQ